MLCHFRKELYAWILRSFKSLSQEESDERFDDSDENEDAFVTWKEYATEEFDLELDDQDFDPNDPMYEEVIFSKKCYFRDHYVSQGEKIILEKAHF